MAMTERRTATNQFSTVMDALQLGKKTGILTVERGEGGTFEEGTVTFANGQVVHAIIGSYQGKAAVTRLFSWQECRFSFISMFPGQIISNQSMTPAIANSTETGIDDTHFHKKRSLMKAEIQDNLSRRPLPLTNAFESLDTVLLILDRQGFTRTHRRLFLLIDGKRSIEELAMLVRRTPDEMVTLLAELEQAGFIQF